MASIDNFAFVWERKNESVHLVNLFLLQKLTDYLTIVSSPIGNSEAINVTVSGYHTIQSSIV